MGYPFWKLILLVVGVVPMATLSVYYATHGQFLIAFVWLMAGAVYGSIFMVGLWGAVGSALVRFGRFVRPYIGRGARATGRSAGNAARAGWTHFWLRPWLVLGVITMLASFWQFGSAYVGRGVDWGAFHLGVILAFASGCFFITHFREWGNIWNFVQRHLVIAWLIASTAGLAVALGHALHLHDDGWWYLTKLSGASLACATTTMAKWWGKVGAGLWKCLSFLGGFYAGKVGGWKGAVFTYAVTLALASLYLYGENVQNPDYDLEGPLYLAFGGFIILLFVGFFGLIVLSVHEAKKKKST